MLRSFATTRKMLRSRSLRRRPMRSLNCMARPSYNRANMEIGKNRMSNLYRYEIGLNRDHRHGPDHGSAVVSSRHVHALSPIFQSGATMKLPRRTFLHLAAGAAALPVVSRVAWAQNYPSRPVRIIVGYAPGGSTDLLARLMGQWLSERLG